MIDIYKRIMQKEARYYYSWPRGQKETSEYKEQLKNILEKINRLEWDLFDDKEKSKINDLKIIIEKAINEVKPRGILWRLLGN